MVKFSPLTAEIGSGVWGTPTNFNRFRVLKVLLHGTLVVEWASAKLCDVEQRAPPIFGRAAITLGIGPHSSILFLVYVSNVLLCVNTVDIEYIAAVDRWMSVLFKYIQPYLYTNGGPIIMVQVTNVWSRLYSPVWFFSRVSSVSVTVIRSLSSLLLLRACLWRFYHAMSCLGVILQVRGRDGMSTQKNGAAAYSQPHISHLCQGGFPLPSVQF